MNTISANLNQLQQKIRAAEIHYGRPPNSVQLIAVSKTQSIERIQQAITAGQRAFGENYLQEAIPKITALVDETLEWHFIGAIQTNKTKPIAEHFTWAHSIDRLKIAEHLNQHRPTNLPPLNICIQVNLDNEPNKAGISLTELSTLAHNINKLPRLKLRGLMTIPEHRSDFADQRQPFQKLHLALQQLQTEGLTLDTLSMGMSDDYEAAIAEGATIIRIGTSIFGPR